MKIAQIECKQALKTTKAARSPSALLATRTTRKQLSAASNNIEHVCNNINSNVVAALPERTTTMTDEPKNNNSDSGSKNNNKSNKTTNANHIGNNQNNNNSTNNQNNNNNNDDLIAEAAKFVLKNGLNGTHVTATAAAAATLLSAAATFQLPRPLCANSLFQPATKATTASTTSLGGHAESSQPATTLSNGLLVASTLSSSSFTATKMAATSAAPPAVHLAGIGGGTLKLAPNTGGVIDYTVNTNTHSSSTLASSSGGAPIKVGSNHNKLALIESGSGCDTVRHPIASAIGAGSGVAGGRLQFFKDGKFILELARSKDGDKGGWVSVPRKVFRTPSATSSTVTPTLATATAYPKNESSTSLSFSDDNSSIQSSPWQRDHCWKQATPRRGISQAMALHYCRPAGVALSARSVLAAQRKRRRPFDSASIVPAEELFDRATANVSKKSVQAKDEAQQHQDVTYDTKKNENLSEEEHVENGESAVKAEGGKHVKVKRVATDESGSTLEKDNEYDSGAVKSERMDEDNVRVDEDCQAVERKEKNKSGTNEEQTSDVAGTLGNNNIEDDASSLSSTSSSSSSTSTATITAARAGSKTPTPTSTANLNLKEKCEILVEDAAGSVNMVEKMNTSEDDGNGDNDDEAMSISVDGESQSWKLNGDIDHADAGLTAKTPSNTTTAKLTTKSESNESVAVAESKANAIRPGAVDGGGENKRLKKQKIRAKLGTIIQKLVDRMPARPVHLSKTSALAVIGNGGGGGVGFSANSSKVSPPSSTNAAASRLVVDYHQQHVSPRKRILRELEKVSLEDIVAVAGGKRSRAKNNSSAQLVVSASSTLGGGKVAQQRVYATSASVGTTTATITTIGATNGQPNAKAKQKTSTATTPTRLYSSYSIHSLLGGGSGSSSSSSSSSSAAASASAAAKKSHDPAIVSNIGFHHTHHLQHQQQQLQQQFLQSYSTDPSYLRAMLASPKSPDNINCGIGGSSGKSPTQASSKKRSPPYASPIHETHSRSPTVGTQAGIDYGRRSPRATPPHDACAANSSSSSSYKMRFANESLSHSPSSSHHLQQHHQGFYSPYMMSPKYVAAPGAAISPTSSRHSQHHQHPHQHHHHSHLAFGVTNASAGSGISGATAASPSHNNIPSSSGSATPSSPPPPSQRTATASPRDSTPRTVPKKTASIRRQFASPTAHHSNHSANNNSNNHSSSCSSPSDHRQSGDYDVSASIADRKTPNASTTASASSSLMQRGSPSGPGPGVGALTSPLHYYMYPPSLNGASNLHPGASAHPPGNASVAGTAAAAAAAATAAAAAYIPSMVGIPAAYYHPYMSTLAALRQNTMWMHHYPGAASCVMSPHTTHPQLPPPPHAAGGSTSSRLSPPFHAYNAYNGVGAAAAANHHHLMMSLHHSGGGALSMIGSGGATEGGAQSPKLTDHRNELPSAATRNTAAASSTKTAAPAPSTIYPSSIRHEHSSDVPLNLSKH